MTIRPEFALYLLVMAGVTYLIRMIPLVFFKEKIKNQFVISFLYYVPYAVLSAMVVPTIFYASDNIVSGAIGFAVALAVSLFKPNLALVASCSCVSVLLCEVVMTYL